MTSFTLPLDAKSANVRYYPSRDGPLDEGWNLTGNARNTSLFGARIEIDWVGTAVQIFGAAEPSTYRLSLDGGEPQDGQPESNGILGAFNGLENRNHTVTLEVVQSIAEVSFTQAALTIELGETGSITNESRISPAVPVTLDGSSDYGQNPYFVFNPHNNWHLIVDNVIDFKQRYVSRAKGDTISFTLGNATAFLLHGFTSSDRKGLQVTVTPPKEEGPPRTRIMNNTAPGVVDVVNYFESGLNDSSLYEVELRNPFADNTVDLRFLQILNASPQDQPTNSTAGPTAPSSKSRLSPGSIAGIVIGVIVFCAVVTGLFIWKWRQRANISNTDSVYPYLETSAVSQRETDGGPLPPSYSDMWAGPIPVRGERPSGRKMRRA